MAHGHDPRNRPATDEGTTEERVAESDASASDSGATAAVTGEEQPAADPSAELRWVRLREPRRALEIGRDGRVVASTYHEGRDAWEVLLETYDGE